MTMQKNDLGRKQTLWVDAAGCVTVASKGRGVEGSLPVFSVDTAEAAEAIQVHFCRLARDGSGLYFLNEPPKDVAGLGAVTDMFRSFGARKNEASTIDRAERAHGARSLAARLPVEAASREVGSAGR